MSDTLTVQLDNVTLTALDQLAEKTERSRTSLVSQAVQDYVALNEWQLRKTEAGIEAADRGDFASDAEVARVRAKFASR
jgi:predicted transcriptional regulator